MSSVAEAQADDGTTGGLQAVSQPIAGIAALPANDPAFRSEQIDANVDAVEPLTTVDVGVPEDIPDTVLPREADARPDLQAADVASPQSTIQMSPLSELDEDGRRNSMIMHESASIPVPTSMPVARSPLPSAAFVPSDVISSSKEELSRPTGGSDLLMKNEDLAHRTVQPEIKGPVKDEEKALPDVVMNDKSVTITRLEPDVSVGTDLGEDEAEEGEIEEDDEDDVVIRPRSRGKRTTMSQEPEPVTPAPKKIKTEAAAVATAASTPVSGVHINDEDDEEGNTKVDEFGELKGDRTYSSRAFRLPMRGNTYYFLATEIARVSGYRDSYLLFNKNRNLKKLMTTEAEKAFLIQQELIPYSYRNRQIGVVNALHIYKTFGARVITRGMRVKDDYYAQRARDQGFTEADFANEEDRPVEDRLFAQAEAQRRAETDADVALASKAQSAVEHNLALNRQRQARNLLMRQHFRQVIKM